MAAKMSAIDRKWQSEYDARTLADAAEIRNDKVRMKGAVTASKRMVTEETKRLSAMKQISKIKPSSTKQVTKVKPSSKKK